MERLTEFHGGAWGMSVKAVENGYDRYSVFSKLAEYENLGITPDQVKEISKFYGELAKELGDYKKLGLEAEDIKDLLVVISEHQEDCDESGISTGTLNALLELAGYKKIGLDANVLSDMAKIFREIYRDVSEGVMISDIPMYLERVRWSSKRLDDYARAEDEGTLIKLPCKVSDIVYEPNKRGFISTYRVTSIIVMTGSRNYNWELIDGIYSNLNGFNEGAIGKSVFLTREAAEKALAEMEGKEC